MWHVSLLSPAVCGWRYPYPSGHSSRGHHPRRHGVVVRVVGGAGVAHRRQHVPAPCLAPTCRARGQDQRCQGERRLEARVLTVDMTQAKI